MKNSTTSIKRLTILYLIFIGAGIIAMGIIAYIIVNLSFETYSAHLQDRLGDSYVSVEIAQSSNEIIEARLDDVRNSIFILSVLAAAAAPFMAFLFAKKRLHPILAAEERQKQFISNASHELRTPLAVLMGELDLALRKERTADEYKNALQHSKEETARLVSLTTQLLLLSRLDENDRLTTSQIDIRQLLEEIIQKNMPQVKQKNLKIDIDIPSETLLIKADPELLQIAFSNLLDNAIKYSPPRETIRILLERQALIARTFISNSGVTLSESEVSNIFDRFNRAKHPKGRGFGLGLAIAKSVIDRHHGKIKFILDNNNTSIVVELPCQSKNSVDFIR